jgi:uncharacterized membrane protein
VFRALGNTGRSEKLKASFLLEGKTYAILFINQVNDLNDMTTSDTNNAVIAREQRQLHRLEFLMDVVFALMLWRIFSRLPQPESMNLSQDALIEFWNASSADLEMIFIGVLLVVFYWIQNNRLFGNLERTDTKHTAISLVQIFALLFFLYTNRLGIEFNGNTGSLLLQSASLAFVGLLALWGWRHARNAGLVSKDLGEAARTRTGNSVSLEMYSALITIPFAFAGPSLWTLSWLIYPVGRWLYKRKQGHKQ